MQTSPDGRIEQLAELCVDQMGDIFWDFEESRDAPSGYRAPRDVAAECIAATLQEFATTSGTNAIYTDAIRMEYRELISRIAANVGDESIVSSLVSEAAWTEAGARAILLLAKRYGTSILRNALALAEALNIEDGEAGF